MISHWSCVCTCAQISIVGLPELIYCSHYVPNTSSQISDTVLFLSFDNPVTPLSTGAVQTHQWTFMAGHELDPTHSSTSSTRLHASTSALTLPPAASGSFSPDIFSVLHQVKPCSTAAPFPALSLGESRSLPLFSPPAELLTWQHSLLH